MIAAPTPRGPISEHLLDSLSRRPGPLLGGAPAPPGDPLAGDDLQLALYLCYELHYRGFAGVDERWEWEPALLARRAELERELEGALRAAVPDQPLDVGPAELDLALRGIAEADEGRSLSTYIEREATLDEALEFVVHRSAYQLKEADPHSWALPRLSGRPKAAMVEIQADEYGGGRPERIHAELFAASMEALGLDRRYGAYLDHIPGDHAGHGQPDVAVRAAPPPPRGDRRPPRRCSR